jgi:hypothetical protein
MERGNPEYRNRIIDALSSPDKDVRYFAAIRSSRLKDRHIASMAIPVLREIVRNESEPELSDRARIALLRLDPNALGKPQVEAQPPKRESKPAPRTSKERLFHVLVLQEGMSQPKVELSLPVSLAQLAIAALDESAKAEIRKKGIDIDNVWESLRNLGPTNILTFRDGPNTVKIWIE